MKIGKLLLTGVIALGLMACNNEEGPEVPKSADATISIKVFPSSDTPGLRATGDLSGGISTAGLAAESKIHTLEAWVFVNGNLEAYKTATIADDAVTEITDITVTSGTRTVVVAANAGIGTQETLTLLKDATKDLSQTITNGLPMTAEPFEVTLVAGRNYYGYPNGTGANFISIDAPKPLVRTNARVAIVEAKVDVTGVTNPIFDGLNDVQVAMFNVPKTSKLFGTSLVASPSGFLYGGAWPSSQSSYTTTGADTAIDPLLTNGVTFSIVNTAAPYYYVNENTSTTAKELTFIVLRGKPTLAGVAVAAEGLYTDNLGYTYYPVWVNASNTKYTYTADHTPDGKITRNTQYNISLTITGIGNPTIDPPVEAKLDVKVSVTPWTVVDQAVTW